MAEQKYKEILQLKEYCDKIGVEYVIENIFDGYAIRFNNGGDFVQHFGSYSSNAGYIEPAIGCRADYTAVTLKNAKRLFKKYKEKLNSKRISSEESN